MTNFDSNFKNRTFLTVSSLKMTVLDNFDNLNVKMTDLSSFDSLKLENDSFRQF